MLVLIGYLAGIAALLVLGLNRIEGQFYYFILVGISVLLALLIIIFRVLAKYFNGFWKIWGKRLQKSISKMLMCLDYFVEMPQFAQEHQQDHETKQQIHLHPSKCSLICWGLLTLIIGPLLAVLSPILTIFLFFCYAQAINEEIKLRRVQKIKSIRKQESISKRIAQMSLGEPLNNMDSKRKDSLSLSTSTNSHYMSGTQIRKHLPPKYYLSLKARSKEKGTNRGKSHNMNSHPKMGKVSHFSRMAFNSIELQTVISRGEEEYSSIVERQSGKKIPLKKSMSISQESDNKSIYISIDDSK